ncbi:MAG: prepilin-type N-terminal cleavage/methylation domain-containing protein [Candidatus Omnitrophica bacterium]|nr:prepilin-type N-terminal cleavage/methylation domain-containing protein [Candidatus Omnitrophota bacterium]
MNKRGMTLVELIVTMVLGGVLLLAMAVQFAADARIRKSINDQNTANQEAVVIVEHMTRVMRFASASTISTCEWGLWGYVEGGHNVPGFAAATTTFVEYANISGELRYWYNCSDTTGQYTVIATGLSSFVVTKSGSNLTISFGVKKGDQGTAVKTTIHMLGA